MKSELPVAGCQLPVKDVEVVAWQNCYDGSWKGLITDEAFAHPAKFAPGLIARIYQYGLSVGWWSAGATIGDPFGGIGGGGIFAGYHGLNWIGVELEEKFVQLGNANLDLHRSKWEALASCVNVKLIRGDSRKFSEIVGADGIVTSPPFLDARSGTTNSNPAPGETSRRNHTTQAGAGYGETPGNIDHLPPGTLDAVVSSPPYADGLGKGGGKNDVGRGDLSYADRMYGRYGASEGQIEQLETGSLDAVTGSLDAVVTSPPYAESLKPETAEETQKKQQRIALSKTLHDGRRLDTQTMSPGKAGMGGGYGFTEGQIGAMREGDLDAVVTSPPYIDTQLTGERNFQSRFQPDEKSAASNAREGYGGSDGQISNLPGGSLDAVVTSPPYADSVHDGNGIDQSKLTGNKAGKNSQAFAEGHGRADGQIGRLKDGSVDAVVTSPPFGDEQPCASQTRAKKDYHAFTRGDGTKRDQLQRDDANIATLGAGETYWAAMKQVYSQCWLALKSGGVMAVVVKDYVKDKQRVPLSLLHISVSSSMGKSETFTLSIANLLFNRILPDPIFVATTKKAVNCWWTWPLSDGKAVA